MLNFDKINVIKDDARNRMMDYIRELVAEFGPIRSEEGLPAIRIIRLEDNPTAQLAEVYIHDVSLIDMGENGPRAVGAKAIQVSYDAGRENFVETVDSFWSLNDVFSLACALTGYVEERRADGMLRRCSLSISIPDDPPRYDIYGALFSPKPIPDDMVPEGKVRFSIEHEDGAPDEPAFINAKPAKNHYGDILVDRCDASVLQRWNDYDVEICGDIDFDDK